MTEAAAAQREERIDAVLFDLDGTLADTAPDLAATLNRVLTEEARKPLPFDSIRPFVSNGANGLLRLGFGDDLGARELDRLRRRFLDIYAAALCHHTRLFKGFSDVLVALEDSGRKWGVVTNKPAYLTEPLLEVLELDKRAACIVSGDSVRERKPHPLPLLHAAQSMQVAAAACVYVGDAERDIQAGLAAGMQTLIAAYGYIETGSRPQEWGAHGMIKEPADLMSWLEVRDRRGKRGLR